MFNKLHIFYQILLEEESDWHLNVMMIEKKGSNRNTGVKATKHVLKEKNVLSTVLRGTVDKISNSGKGKLIW